MKLSGEARIGAPPEAVWAALVDPATLKRLIPGCESMTGSPETGFDITVTQGVGGMRARLAGRIDLSEVEPARGCLLSAEGTSGAAGMARGTARIRLVPLAGGTRLFYDVDARLGGRLARLPVILVQAVARRMVDGFFNRFRAEVEGLGGARRAGWLGRAAGS